MLSLLFILSLAYTYAQVAESDCAEYRSFACLRNDAENSVAVAGAKVTVTSTGDFSGGAALNAAGFKFVCGPSQVAFGAACLDATATVDWKPTANGQGSLIYSINAAFAEIVIGASNLILYKDRNGVAGLQYTLGEAQFDCNVDNGKDCFILSSGIDLSKDLTYTPLGISSQSCNLPADQGYNSNCTIWTITSTGYIPGLTNTNVFMITLRLANQKLNFGGHSIGPDFGKVDFEIWYPWTDKGQTTVKTEAYVAMSLYAGGKAGTAGVQGGVWQDKDALIFAVSKDQQAAVIAWDSKAQSDGVDGTIYVDGISGATITAYDCSSCDILSKWIVGTWQVGMTIASWGGWTSHLVLLSWSTAGADHIIYDPVVGMAPSSDVVYNDSAAGLLMPSFLTMMACFILYRFFSR